MCPADRLQRAYRNSAKTSLRLKNAHKDYFCAHLMRICLLVFFFEGITVNKIQTQNKYINKGYFLSGVLSLRFLHEELGVGLFPGRISRVPTGRVGPTGQLLVLLLVKIPLLDKAHHVLLQLLHLAQQRALLGL